ncbi:PREDICTED: lysosomal acid phosphatase-like isoform X1 [Polistes canadensis]|uniref:lysosomal acid phosphatase-like isoform X1 n=2 Tax=Polistes canadensis TaxID=91411 RepID=UPI000718FC08|nr:PREDICTED: lysosomal acid phosphatase-like isoform X1 [Polistes canadensis]
MNTSSSLFALLLTVIKLRLTLESPITSDHVHKTNDALHNYESNEDTLRLVSVIMRHGERAPQDTYPNDPYVSDTMKPYGWGQLTNVGRVNQYNQGIYLRQRYNQFLGQTYNPDIFYLQCTSVDRTKMSAMLEAAGLWKPTEEQSFKSDFPWQPVTLFYQRRSEDTLMLIWDTCPKYGQTRNMILRLPEVQEVQNKNEQLYEELSNLTGMTIATPDDVSSLYSTLKAEETMNLTLPYWTKKYYPDKLIPLTMYDFQLNTYNDMLKRLKGGPMIKKIIYDMLAKKERTLHPETRKMFMYVGHDSTVVTLLDVLHIWNNQMPEYNIMIMIELHEDTNGWNVQIFLRNTTNYEPYPMTIPGCATICPINEFIQILKPMIPDNWEEECKTDGDYTLPPAPAP